MKFTPWLGRMLATAAAIVGARVFAAEIPAPSARLLYVAVPGIRNYLEYGGHGVLVYDIDHGHRLLRRIAAQGLEKDGKPSNVKGICASAATGRLYVSTIASLQCFDLLTDKLLWEKTYEGGCDRPAITPDGAILYLPSFEGDHWFVVDAHDGSVLKKLTLNSKSHNTVVTPDGREAYLAGLGSPRLAVVDTTTREVVREVGPFSASIRPFTVDGRHARVYVNVNQLLGFEVGDLATGRVIGRTEVTGVEQGPVKRHGCPSHGIALTRDEKELWLADGHNSRVHFFDLSGPQPRQLDSIAVRDQPGWITFGIDGRLAYISSGEVVDVSSHKIVTTLQDENGGPVGSEKLMEIDFENGRPVRAGDQFALGGVH